MRSTTLVMIFTLMLMNGALWANHAEAAKRVKVRDKVSHVIESTYRRVLKFAVPEAVANHFTRKAIAYELKIQGVKASAEDVSITKVAPTGKWSTLENGFAQQIFSSSISGFKATNGGSKIVSPFSVFEKIAWQAKTSSGEQKKGTVQRLRHPAAFPALFPHSWTITETLKIKPSESL